MPQALATRPTPIVTIISDYCRQVLGNRASLPSMPDVATRIHGAMTSPNWSLGAVAAIIKGDPGTTTFLIQIANSALYAGTTPIREVERAIARLGVDNTRNLVTAHALRSMFVTRSAMLDALMRRTWRTSTRLAARSTVLARECPGFVPERALLAGLLQDIGVLPILNVLKRYQEQLTSEAQVLSAINRYAPQVGMVLLKHWNFEPDIIEVARSRGDWFRDPRPIPDLADLVLIARLHGNIAEGQGDGLPRLDELPAFAKFPIGGLRPDSSLEYLHDQDASVKALMGALGAG